MLALVYAVQFTVGIPMWNDVMNKSTIANIHTLSSVCAMLLEVCSGCDLAAKSGRFASMLCCATLSVQGLSVLMQVRTICPSEMTLRPLYRARLFHLPLSLLIFYLLLPQRAQETFSTLCGQVITMHRLPPDCALLIFAGCCFAVCELSRTVGSDREDMKKSSDKVANQY